MLDQLTPDLAPSSRRANFTGSLVVAVCDEGSALKAEVDRIAQRLSAHLHLRVAFYCKCTPWQWCSKRLPNVGREGHTHLYHIAADYYRLDVISLFINGGAVIQAARPRSRLARNAVESKSSQLSRVTQDVIALVERSSSAEMLARAFADGSGHKQTYRYCNNGGRAHFVKLAAPSVCHAAATASFCSEAEAGRRHSLHSKLTTCAHLGSKGLGCNNGSVCHPQRNSCRWRSYGSTANNARVLGANASILTQASPASMAEWMCTHWSLTPEVLQACSWAWYGTFAVG